MNLKRKYPPGLSDSTLSALWRKAVLHVGRNTCVICHGSGMLQAHHVIHRRYKVLRWNWRNGVPVHAGDCHETANMQGVYAAYPAWREYLVEKSRQIHKQYLTDNGMSESEWRAEVKADLLAELGGDE